MSAGDCNQRIRRCCRRRRRPAVPSTAALIEDLVAANRILADQGVLDAYGHVSMRHPRNPDRYLLSRSLAPSW